MENKNINSIKFIIKKFNIVILISYLSPYILWCVILVDRIYSSSFCVILDFFAQSYSVAQFLVLQNRSAACKLQMSGRICAEYSADGLDPNNIAFTKICTLSGIF